MMAEPVEVLLATRRFRVLRHAFQAADGQTHFKETVEHPGAVTILPLLDDDRVCLIRNRRLAVGKTLVELPAGTLEPNEDPAATAARELIEETGYRAAKLEKLVEFLYVARYPQRTHAPVRGHATNRRADCLEPGEQIETLVVSWADAMRMTRDGRIEDAKTLVGLLLYEQTRNAPARA